MRGHLSWMMSQVPQLAQAWVTPRGQLSLASMTKAPTTGWSLARSMIATAFIPSS